MPTLDRQSILRDRSRVAFLKLHELGQTQLDAPMPVDDIYKAILVLWPSDAAAVTLHELVESMLEPPNGVTRTGVFTFSTVGEQVFAKWTPS